jgi:putative transposase
MTYVEEGVRKNSLRLQGYDYAQAGYYFVTVCTHERQCLFGEVAECGITLNEAGLVIQSIWNDLPCRFPGIGLDEYIIMPNHIHGIIILNGESVEDKPTPALGEVIRAFKAVAAHTIRVSHVPTFAWQSKYYDHIIRNDKDLDRIRQYIATNPARWLEKRNQFQ